MLYVVVHEKGGQTQRFDFGGDQFAIGREEDNDLVLDRVNVSKHHLRFRRHEGTVECIDLESTNGTYINGRRVEGARVVRRADRIYVGDYILMLEGDDAVIDPAESIESLTARVSKERPRFADLSADETSLVTSAKRVAAAGVESTYLDKIADRIIRDVLQAAPRLDPIKQPKRSDVPDEDRSKALAKLDQAINAVKATLEDGVDIDELEQRLAAELLEYGPLSSLMRDDAIREINVTGAGPIHVVRDGELGSRLENLRFTVPRALGLAIRRLARKRGLWFEGAQIIEGVVDHGFHMHALLPPHQGRVPVLCLRRIKTDAKSLAALVSEGVLSDDMREFLLLMLRNSRRVIVSASGGVNLDRFMEALVGEIPTNMRVALVSDGGLLGVQHRGWVHIRRMP
ncbi:MAG: FHA domain-containing protein, partial [Myxococcales bacterium]|nr:FHA domain-containing protein [Myxococcales bacterium]